MLSITVVTWIINNSNLRTRNDEPDSNVFLIFIITLGQGTMSLVARFSLSLSTLTFFPYLYFYYLRTRHDEPGSKVGLVLAVVVDEVDERGETEARNEEDSTVLLLSDAVVLH